MKREQEASLRSEQGEGLNLPYGVYLLISAIILIAAVREAVQALRMI